MKHLFTNKLLVRARDIDARDHVNNSLYFTYMEESLTRWLLDNHLSQNLKVSTAFTEVKIQFKRPIIYPNEIQVDMYAPPAGRSTLLFNFKISLACEPKILCAVGEIEMVFVDLKTHAITEIPEEIRNHLG